MIVNDRKRNELSPAVMVLVLLFFLLPPLGIVGAVILAIVKQAKKTTSPENRTFRPEREKTRRSGKTEKEPTYKHHSHTPISYSYDACAREKRLEQLKVLYEAGILDAVEYQQRRQEILAVR